MIEYNYYIICGDNCMKKLLSFILVFIIIFSFTIPVSANIDKVDLEDDDIRHELVRITLAAKKVDAATPEPRTKADGTIERTAAV